MIAEFRSRQASVQYNAPLHQLDLVIINQRRPSITLLTVDILKTFGKLTAPTATRDSLSKFTNLRTDLTSQLGGGRRNKKKTFSAATSPIIQPFGKCKLPHIIATSWIFQACSIAFIIHSLPSPDIVENLLHGCA
ncbi:hypothetical protein AVEN_87863-1 [Araneus ventricosus]|uniref:Uncharacterized protein n=1 Tax=Araneus ventricosus TaxID=182803 RepID=A0A4Y2BDH4_ARAVE|nr:hypothetical protein AVEN_87863-1 [Araneus ventricosus]